MKKTDEINKEIAELEYANYSLKETATTIKKYEVGKVMDINENRSNNGEQIYAIASDMRYIILIYSAII